MQDTPQLADRHDAVAVIGAGASGLAAIKNLREQGFAVDCYERETSVGGAWNWRHDRSPVYAGTHLISSRPLTEFPDFPMPDSWPDYPHHSQLLSYLERYAEHFGLGEHEAAKRHLEEAVRLCPENWNYFRQSMVLEPELVGELNTAPESWAALDGLGEQEYHPPIEMPGIAGPPPWLKETKILHPRNCSGDTSGSAAITEPIPARAGSCRG